MRLSLSSLAGPFFLVGLLIGLGTCSTASQADEPRPNILFILVDDLGWRDVGFNGSTFYETPYLDSLAARSACFPNGYAACPVCSPTRASILTGQFPARMQTTDWFGAPQPETVADHWTRNKPLLPAPYREHLPLEAQTLAETLAAAGYRTFFAGKWHLGETPGYGPTQQGFAINRGGYDHGSPRSYFAPYDNPQLADGPPGEYLTDRLAQETADFIRAQADTAAPFLAYLSFYAVHTPLQALDSLREKYAERLTRMRLPDPFGATEGDRQVRTIQSNPTYAAMVEGMDQAVGKVLRALRESGQADNTIIVFTSDNGGLSTSEGHPTSNLPLRAGKGWLYEGGIRVPYLIHWPGVTRQATTYELPVSSPDFYPTLLAMAGLELLPQQHRDGNNLAPLLRGETPPATERSLFWHYPHYGNQGGAPGSAVRRGDWKLIEWFEDGRRELYNLREDPGETQDLSATRPDLTEELYQELAAWRDSVDARLPTRR
jgi:arylsulfatase A-like enzyme